MQSILVATMSNGMYHSLFNILTHKKEKNIIIDPFSCLAKLALLSHSQNGTKISISNNQINFNDPNYGQGILRFLCGDNREDLHNLLAPIQKARDWFYDKNDKNIVYIFEKAACGLKNLKNSYGQFATIQHAIDRYTDVLVDGSTTKKEDPKKYSNSRLNSNDIPNNTARNRLKSRDDDEPKITDLEESARLDTIQAFLKGLWTEREINIVINLFREYEDKEDMNEKIHVFNSIVSYCDMKEKKLNKFLEEKSSILED